MSYEQYIKHAKNHSKDKYNQQCSFNSCPVTLYELREIEANLRKISKYVIIVKDYEQYTEKKPESFFRLNGKGILLDTRYDGAIYFPSDNYGKLIIEETSCVEDMREIIELGEKINDKNNYLLGYIRNDGGLTLMGLLSNYYTKRAQELIFL